MASRCWRLMLVVAVIGCFTAARTSSLMAQPPGDAADDPQPAATAKSGDVSQAPARVDVNPVARDEEIGKRLQNVLDATGWFNGREHSWLKVQSSVMRLVKLAFQNHGISMPDEAREVVFPKGIPITMVDGKPETRQDSPVPRLPLQTPHEECEVASTKAEGGLASEAGVIEEQARKVRPLNDGENLLNVPLTPQQ